MQPLLLNYSQLNPQQVLDALDAVDLRGDGRILQLNSYENRVFQLFLEDGSAVVTKFYRPGRWSDAQILEEHSFALELAAAEVPVVPPLVLRRSIDAGSAASTASTAVQLQGDPPTLATWDTPEGQHRFAVFQRCAGREPELQDPEALRQLGRFIGRMHAVGARRSFLHRHHLQAAADGAEALQTLLHLDAIPPTDAGSWQSACKQALLAVNAAFDHVQSQSELKTLRLHGDCHLGNVLWRDGAPHVVDLDDAMQGPAVQDLWMLVSGDPQSMSSQLRWLLEGYEQFFDFDDRELALIEPLRTLRMVRHSAWLARRWSDPSFPISFPFFGQASYWHQQSAQLREQLQLMQEAAQRWA